MKLINAKIIAIIGTADYVQTAYADLRRQDNITIIGNSCFDYYKFFCKKFHLTELKIVYYILSFYFVKRYCSHKKTNVILMHGVDHLWNTDLPFYSLAKKSYDVKFVGLFWDSIDFVRYEAYKYKDKYDLMINADPEINQKYGVVNYPHAFYSKVDIKPIEEKCDVFYLGEDGGRLPMMEKVYAKLTKMGLTCVFYCGRSEKAGKTINGIKHIARMPYLEYLSHLNNCRVILDILKPGIKGPSFRHIEGTVYDKKVLTNNPIVKELCFYDEKQFYVFDDNLVFDEEFLRRDLQKPNVHKDDLSPLKFIEFVCSQLGLEKNTV